ncbi:hypothetical protein C2S51_021921 [Perilla frutescens var. frutescens]|nr:hypothetical protein C2S51_021921 [Perilla frutescens var. frutescens]
MVRRRIIARHSGRWEIAQYVDGVEELIIMSSDDICFRTLMREIHELLETDPISVEYQLSWMSSTNSGRQTKTRLKDDADLLDLLHEQSQEMIVYVFQRGRSSSMVIPDTVPEHREPVREEVRDDMQHYEAPEEEEEIPTTDEEAEENVRTDLLESVFTEFTGWIRSTGGTRRLIGMTGGASSSNTMAEDVSERDESNWLVLLVNIDVAGPLSWDEPSAANTDELQKGAIFRTKDDLALAMGPYHMQNRVEYAVYRSNKTRLIYMCKHGRECPFKLCAVVDGVVWRIYKFDGTHTCHMDMSRVAPRQVPARVIVKNFARKLVDERVVLKPKEMVSELLREYGIQIDYSFALRSRNIAIEMIYGDFDKSYAQLPAFLHTLQLRNPGTLYEFQTNTVHELKYTFLALERCISAFHAGARQVVVIDGTHLKGKNKGILFVAVTKDGNEQVLPIAVGIGPIENDDTWIWFLNRLHITLGEIEDLLIVSDQHKSIKNAVAAVFPRATHGLCYYHLQTKMAKRGSNVIGLFKEAAYAYQTDVFQRHLSALEMLSRPAYEKLCNIDPQHWSRSQCPVRRFGFITSNAAESLNARLLWARRLPICLMLESFRKIVDEWFVERRAAAQTWDHVLTQPIVDKLSKNVEQGRCFSVRCTTLAHLWKVEVGMKSFMVDLHHRTCDCREFELDLIPCSHAAAAIRFSGGNIYEFVDRCYKTETIASMYDSVIMGLPSPEDWIVPSDGCPLVRAPVITKQTGRPRMSRARGGAEASSSQWR